MGRRKGRTGPGGAVVSSLSQKPGGTISSKKGEQPGNSSNHRSKHGRADEELNQLAKVSGRGGSSSNSDFPSSSGPVVSYSSGWLGKSPQQMLREWCIKNSRSRPSFYPVDGSEGLMKCVVHRGRKDGKKGTGLAFELIVGVGDKAGEDFAALNVLHRIEHGKPLERLLAPEYRPTWLELDKRYDAMQKIKAQKQVNHERREKAAKRRETNGKMKQSATIHISSDSRQMIEDALLLHKSTDPGAQKAAPSAYNRDDGPVLREKIVSALTRMGFSEFDAIDASAMFYDYKDAVNYLCLTLDESELPASFAPKSEVEVAQFFPNASGKGPLLDQFVKSELTRFSCLSKEAVEKALKTAEGDAGKAYSLLFDILTHNSNPVENQPVLNDVSRSMAEKARADEEESIKAIFDEDVKVGIGCLKCFATNWTAVVKLPGGCPGIRYPNPISIAFIDSNNCYPISAPLVTIVTSRPDESAEQQNASAAERRLLMRAAAGKIVYLRETNFSSLVTDPVFVIHHVIDFIADATREQLLEFAFKRRLPDAVTDFSDLDSKDGNRSNVIQVSVSDHKHSISHQQCNAKKLFTVDELRSSPEHSAMLKQRRVLPAFSVRQEVLETISQNQVVIIHGATGSGKSTQIPQFILEDAAKSQVPTFVVCSQPRRIAAISVAERVAAERCQAVGDSVGYQVKLNSKQSSSTRLLFCTTGILLRRLQGDPSLRDVTHILVDEVHERSIETDFLLLLLHEILPTRPELKVILMSATLDAEKFASYFASKLSVKRPKAVVPVISISGRTFPVKQFFLNEAVDFCGYTLKPGDKYAAKPKINQHFGKYGPEPPTDADLSTNRNSATLAALADEPTDDDMYENDELHQYADQANITGTSISASRPKESTIQNDSKSFQVSMIDEEQVNIDLIYLLVKRIDAEGRTGGDMGAILIFLPGIAEISSVIRRLTERSLEKHLWVLPLHSFLSPDEQRKVFMKAPVGKRKVICSTNISETSITVEDVTFVIDTGRVKEMSYDSMNGCSVLQEQFISRAASKQRAGRAGRTSAGNCYLLVRQITFENRFKAQTTPEILRMGLEHLVLNALAIIPDNRMCGDPKSFLSKAVDPPSNEAIDIAIINLLDIGALVPVESKSNLTECRVKLSGLGKLLSRLPVDAKIGKLLIYGLLFGCIDAALTIGATISERSPFFAPFNRREEAREAKKSFAGGKSDLLVFVKAFNEWQAILTSGGGAYEENDFCAKNFLSKKTLMMIADGRKQFADALRATGLCGEDAYKLDWYIGGSLNQNDGNERVIRAVICAAFYPNIVRIDAEQKYKKVNRGTIAIGCNSRDLKLRDKAMQRLFIHPESVNFFESNYDTRWLAYHTKVLTSKLFIRDATMVSPYAIVLFGGDIEVLHEKGQIAVDKWVIFKSPARIGVLAREMRRELDGLLSRKFDDNAMDLAKSGQLIIDAVVKLISTEIYQ